MICEQPVRIDHLFDDPDAMRALVAEHAPYWPVMRYFANPAEEAAQNGGKSVDAGRDAAKHAKAMRVMPVFRGDWAYDTPKVAGAEAVLYDEQLIEAAKQVFGGSVVVPQIVFVNLTTPMPAQPTGHVDIPAFRGIDRTEHPTWLLQMMGQSGLFEDVRIRIATSVAWLYCGDNGGFSYWPDGPDGPRRRHATDLDNTAIVGDNDFMFHQVERVGSPDDPLARGLTLDSLLHPAADDADRVGHHRRRGGALPPAVRAGPHQRLVEGQGVPRRRGAAHRGRAPRRHHARPGRRSFRGRPRRPRHRLSSSRRPACRRRLRRHARGGLPPHAVVRLTGGIGEDAPRAQATAASRSRRAWALPTCTEMSARNAKTTITQPNPVTPFTGA